MFKPGQHVIAVKAPAGSIIKNGEHYHVNGVNRCSCGIELIDVGFTCFDGTWCTKCPHYTLPPVWWMNASMFRLLEEISDTKYEDIIKEVEVDCTP